MIVSDMPVHDLYLIYYTSSIVENFSALRARIVIHCVIALDAMGASREERPEGMPPSDSQRQRRINTTSV